MSCIATSRLAFARTTPVRPPNVNRPTKPKAKSIGAVILTEPPYEVPIQEKTLIPDGTAINIDAAVK